MAAEVKHIEVRPLEQNGDGKAQQKQNIVRGSKWFEKYAELLEKFFKKLPPSISTICATIIIFILGATLRGEWIVILVAAIKQMRGDTILNHNTTAKEFFSRLLEQNTYDTETFTTFFIAANAVSYTMYFLCGGFLHWYYYKSRRDKAAEWKVQPDKWLPPDLERHEILWGCWSLLFAGFFSAALATYIYNGNPSYVYFQFDEYGWLWFFLQFPVIFIVLDYVTYHVHRLFHTRFYYKHFHKIHHKYKQPTAFSTTAMHPVEMIHFQLPYALWMFIVPTHWLAISLVLMYNYYHGIIDHSGINFKAQWWQPWQPDVEFHDQHHEFFHVNFGFNMVVWDKLHGTIRKPNLVYTEDTFNGEAPVAGTEEARAVLKAAAMRENQISHSLRKKN